MKRKLPVSVCMLVKNEEKNLYKSLPPLGPFAEILVYDSGSTDKSSMICEIFGAKVIQGPWLGFSKTRKKLFESASQPWIFWLDADEVVPPALLAEISTLFQEEINVAAFNINRMIIMLGKPIRHGNWFPDWNVRLFHSKHWSISSDNVHEKVLINGTIYSLKNILEHHSFSSKRDYFKRISIYEKLWVSDKCKSRRRVLPFEGFLRACWRFFRGYILRRGFLDGKMGIWIAYGNFFEVYNKYLLLDKNLKKTPRF